MEYYYNSRPLCLFLLSFFILATSALANFAVFDDYWQQKAAEARAAAQASYHPDPMAVTNSFNKAVHKSFEEKNTTGRALRQQYNGPCMSTNPIDRCWRCDPNWADDRKKVVRCAKGFGRNAGGGKDGDIYVVTDPSDDDMQNPKPGTLRYGVIQDVPLWIIFDHDMVIRLSQELIMNSNKTIDGRGMNIHIAYGAGITVQFIKNIILLNLHVHDTISTPGGLIRDSNNHFGLRTRADGDGISIFGASNIWIDHVSMWNCSDGLIDIIEGSTSITVSNGHFTQHNDCMLFGASDAFDGDKIMQVTMAFNHFGNGLIQRMPRVRYGFVHVVNNDYTHWIMYALGGSMGPTIVSQGNRFTAPDNPRAKEVTKRDFAPESVWRTWNWTSEDDVMMNGARFEPAGSAGRAEITKEMTRFDLIKSKPGSFVGRLTRFAGVLNCKVGQPC